MNDTLNILPEEIRSALERVGRRRTYAQGNIICVAGELPKGVFLIEKGAIRITLSRSTHHDVEAQKVGGGILLGLSEAISGQAHKFTAHAIEECDALFVGRERFLEFLKENQVFCLRIVRFLSETLHQAYYALQQGIRH